MKEGEGLVERLRRYGHHEAADEIERLTAEVARLKACIWPEDDPAPETGEG